MPFADPARPAPRRRALLLAGAAVALAALAVGGLGTPLGAAEPDSVATGSDTAGPNGATAPADLALAAPLDAVVQDVLADTTMPSAFWGISVVDVESGRSVYRWQADRLLVPASNLKLFTTAVALDAFGPDHRYATRLYFDGATDGATMRGDLVLRGAGDPSFGSRYATGDPLAAWAARLAAAGVRRLEGRIIGDDDALEDAPYAEGWDVTHVTTETYAPQAGGLSYADNLVRLEIAGASGGQARITAAPGGHVELRPRVAARAGRGYSPFRVQRRLGSNVIDVSGNVSASYRGTIFVPIEDPTGFTLAAFAEALREAGIEVAAELVDADALAEPLAYEGALAEPLLVHLSPPMAELAGRINQQSDNFYAEQVFRSFAAGGSTAAGGRRVTDFLARAGIPTSGLSIRDGSGLSRKNLVTPESMARLLAHMATHPAADAYLASLAEGGGARSTLRYRLQDVPVRAKTGSLEYVRTLSGFVTGPNGRPLAFALMANHFTSRPARIAEAQDRMVRALATGRTVPRPE